MNFVDVAKDFKLFAYHVDRSGPAHYDFTSPLEDTMLDSSQVLSASDFDSVMAVLPGYLPGLYTGKFIPMSYNPDRTTRHLGFDQGVPSNFPPSFHSDAPAVRASFDRFVFKGPTCLGDHGIELYFQHPVQDRHLFVTKAAHDYQDYIRRRALNFIL